MLFVTLFSPKGKGTDAVNHLKRLEDKENIKIRDVFFTFGRYDGILIFEAPNERAAMRFVMETGFATEYAVETLIAIPAREL